MKSKLYIGFFALLVLSSCKTVLQVAEVKPQKNTSITAELKEDEAFTKVIAPYKTELEGKMNTKISHTKVELNKSGDNSNLGNLLADYTLEGAEDWAKKNGIPGIDAAVINIGGIRSIIGAGDILVKNVYEVMPFENEVVIVKMNGKDVQGLFDYYAQTQKNNPVSKLTIETNEGKISRQLINGEPLKTDKIYYIATSDYLALGGDNMKFFSKGEMIATGIKMRDLFLEKFKEKPEINASNDVRLIFNNKKK
ncbi:MAG: 5'-nucleotidase C-terminal domain-containing protein [Bergeyella sp.]